VLRDRAKGLPMAHDTTSGPSRAGWPAVCAVFAMVVGFTYSDDLVEFAHVVAGRDTANTRWITFLVDYGLVAGTLVLAWRMNRAGHTPSPPRQFLSALLRGWWMLGAVLVILLHFASTALAARPDTVGAAGIWINLGLSLCFVLAMGMVLAAALDGAHTGPAGMWARSTWIIPLMIGTFVVQIASALWFPILDTDAGCAGEISIGFFAQMVQVIPVLLITLGIELSFMRRAGVLPAGERAAPVLTVVLLCVAEVLALSMLVKGETTHCGAAAVWHEYIAFVVTVQAGAIGLATLVWLLITGTTDD
jgi:hypothetical protein